MKEEYKDKIPEMINRYKEMEKWGNESSMIREVKWQYAEMANGGQATDGLDTCIRDQYYKGYPDEFFQEVCDLMGWEWRHSNA